MIKNTILLSLYSLLVVAYPLYYILIASVSDPYDVYAGKTFWLPSQFTLKGYAAVFSDDSILLGYWNSIKYTVVGTIFSVVMIYITAYPLSNPDLPGRKFFNIFFVITMYFGGGLIPTYLIVRDTGLINTIWAMFLPGGVAVSNMIIARNFFETSIPKELKEAAEIDGASKLRIFWDTAPPWNTSTTGLPRASSTRKPSARPIPSTWPSAPRVRWALPPGGTSRN